MTNRQRFHETMNFGTPDRAPYFEEGIRNDVIKAWRKQGLSRKTKISDLFQTDHFNEIDLDPFSDLNNLPESPEDLSGFKVHLNKSVLPQFQKNWRKIQSTVDKNDEVIFLKVHRGFFLSMGVYKWERFMEVISLLIEKPDFVKDLLLIQGEFIAGLLESVLQDIRVDAVIFSEPIGGNEGPLISPDMYDRYVLSGYDPILEIIREHNINIVILRTYANIRLLMPPVLKHGFNCLWACETNSPAMEYRDIRKEFGRYLRLIGGIDLDALRHGKEEIRRELEQKIPPLLTDGGYIPIADGRIRADIPFENY
ncbi:MAG: uroporphyrinogen decarboxylase family protein, partial [Calditrichaceae bacterium]